MLSSSAAPKVDGAAPLTKVFMADIDDDEPLFALTEADVANMEVDSTLLGFALTSHVSPEVRAECEKELAEAKKHGYKIRKE